MSLDGEEKTEQPSEYKLREARKKGQVAKSADVCALMSLFCALMLLAFSCQFIFNRISNFWLRLFTKSFVPVDHLLNNYLREALDLWIFLCLPVLLAAALGAMGGNLCQFGFLLTSHPLKPDLKRIDPVAGLKKIISKDRVVELIKQLVKFSAVFLIIYLTIKDSLRNVSMLFRLDLVNAMQMSGNLLMVIIIRVLLCFLVVAIFDFFWQRYAFLKSMRMSKYEVKKEYKQQEGDPHIKQERRRIHQEMLEEIASKNIKDASVVITNPSHLAVALKYDEKQDQAPRLLAKGIGKSAKSIIDEARHHSIPIMRNVPLARDLQWLAVNEEIPPNLYDSVAEILTFIYELNRKNSEINNEDN